MDWQHFKDDAWNGLVNGLTFVAVLGVAAKAFYEFWLKKRFKRYEARLDALASKEETVFSFLHPERAKAVLELYPLCVDAASGARLFLGVQVVLYNSGMIDDREKIRLANVAAEEGFIKLSNYFKTKRPLFEIESMNVIDDFMDYINTVLQSVDYFSKNEKRQEMDTNLTVKRRAVLAELQRLLGVINKKSLQEQPHRL